MNEGYRSHEIDWRGWECIDMTTLCPVYQGRDRWDISHAFIADENGNPLMVFRKMPGNGNYLLQLHDVYQFNYRNAGRNAVLIDTLLNRFSTVYSPTLTAAGYDSRYFIVKNNKDFIGEVCFGDSGLAVVSADLDKYKVVEDSEEFQIDDIYDSLSTLLTEHHIFIDINNDNIYKVWNRGDYDYAKLSYTITNGIFDNLMVEPVEPVINGRSLLTERDHLYYYSYGSDSAGGWTYFSQSLYDYEGNKLNTVRYRTQGTSSPLPLSYAWNNMGYKMSKVPDPYGVDQVVVYYANLKTDENVSVCRTLPSAISDNFGSSGNLDFKFYFGGRYYFIFYGNNDYRALVYTTNFSSFSVAYTYSSGDTVYTVPVLNKPGFSINVPIDISDILRAADPYLSGYRGGCLFQYKSPTNPKKYVAIPLGMTQLNNTPVFHSGSTSYVEAWVGWVVIDIINPSDKFAIFYYSYLPTFN